MSVGATCFPDIPKVEGVRFGVVEAGIKYQDRKDLVLIEICHGASVAGVFTKNAFCAAPVVLSKQHLEQEQPRFFIINTGNANAGTGSQGFEDALKMCSSVAECSDEAISQEQVLPFSTGVIGEKLPIDKIVAAVPDALKKLSSSTWKDVAEGIMTTDTRPKGATRQFSYQGVTYTLAGVSKGAGMIKPNMATMLGFIVTDAKIERSFLQKLLKQTADKSFNRITIDSDTSTNDSCMLIATGKAGDSVIDSVETQLGQLFEKELTLIMKELAQAIVRDGEGATKFVEILVDGASSAAEALDVAFDIAHSPLVKTALFASDPNWGRILAVVGRANLSELDVSRVQIYINDIQIVKDGARADSYTEEQGQQAMAPEEIKLKISLGRGEFEECVWTTDLSHEYVSINADYRS